MEDYEEDYEVYCPLCNYTPLHNRYCQEFGCEDGFVEKYFDDIEIEGMGDMVECEECHGTGVEWWCPKCGANLSGNSDLQKQFISINEEENSQR